jgi:hypothetical protein
MIWKIVSGLIGVVVGAAGMWAYIMWAVSKGV